MRTRTSSQPRMAHDRPSVEATLDERQDRVGERLKLDQFPQVDFLRVHLVPHSSHCCVVTMYAGQRTRKRPGGHFCDHRADRL